MLLSCCMLSSCSRCYGWQLQKLGMTKQTCVQCLQLPYGPSYAHHSRRGPMVDDRAWVRSHIHDIAASKAVVAEICSIYADPVVVDGSPRQVKQTLVVSSGCCG
jgi:hypothetical protein